MKLHKTSIFFIQFLILVFTSCTEHSESVERTFENVTDKIKLNTYSYINVEKDTINRNYFWGIEQEIFLGEIEYNSSNYEVYSVIKKILLADGFKYKYLLVFKNDYLQFEKKYDMEELSNLPVDVFSNQLVFYNSEKKIHCFEKNIEIIEMMCISCADNICFGE